MTASLSWTMRTLAMGHQVFGQRSVDTDTRSVQLTLCMPFGWQKLPDISIH